MRKAAAWVILKHEDIVMDSIQQCQARALARAAELAAAKKQELSQEELYKNYKISSSLEESIKNKNNKFYNGPDGLKMLINTDRTFLKAQEWGMYPGALTNLCNEYGVLFVKERIDRVAKIGDGYFNRDNPVAKQRGVYCRAVITREGKCTA
jgi:hypothetical protein